MNINFILFEVCISGYMLDIYNITSLFHNFKIDIGQENIFHLWDKFLKIKNNSKMLYSKSTVTP